MQPAQCVADANQAQPLPVALTRRRDYRLAVARRDGPAYAAASALVEEQYERHFNCVLRDHYPAYLCLYYADRLLAACGFRSAVQPLFLEQYLDVPIERALVDRGVGMPQREQIVELGAFAVRQRALAVPFMNWIAPALRDMGFNYAVCTATLPVRRCLQTLGVPTTLIARADAGNLHSSLSDWGHYYQSRPAVIAGPIPAAGFSHSDFTMEA